MAIIFLHPTSFVDPGANVASGLVTDVDELVSAADGALQVSVNNGWSGADSTVQFVMEDMPGDADTINSVKLRVRAQVAGGQVDDTATWLWDINGTGMSGSVSWTEADDGAGLSNKEVTTTGSPTVANVDAAQIRVDQTAFSQTMSPDGLHHDWDCLELEVDYEVSGGVTLTADPGALTFTGAVANFTTTLAATAGALLLTGANADFAIATLLDAQPSELTLTGAAASLDTTLDAQPSELTLTGANADFAIGLTLDAQPGALVLTGAEADFVGAAPLVVRRGGRFLLEAELEEHDSKVAELKSLVEPQIRPKSPARVDLTGLEPITLESLTGVVPAPKKARIQRLLDETGISLAELLKIIG